MRSVLVAALASCADAPRRHQARRFLVGLSTDELPFFAEFLGSFLLESALDSPEPCARSRPELAERIAEFQAARLGPRAWSSWDQDHKTILLLEFLCRNGLPSSALTARAGRA